MVEQLRRLLEKIQHGNPPKPSQVRLPDEHVDVGEKFGEPFRPDEHYFVVQVNEMLLQYARQWWRKFDPMTWVLTEFTYGTQQQSVPFVLGPNLLKSAGQEVSQGVLVRDIRVAGIHPYRGGKVSLSVILYQVPAGDGPGGLLRVLETAAGALDFATDLVPYLKVANTLVNGVSELLGINGVSPVVSCRHDLDPDAGGNFHPGCYALLGPGAPPPEQLWVRDGRLLTGSAMETAQPLTTCDFVLYTISRTSSRSDARALPALAPFWQRALRAAEHADEASVQVARNNLATFETELYLSPDLTPREAEELYEEYHAELAQRLERARNRAHLGRAEAEMDEDLKAFRNIVSRAFEI
jgi:hypothetical protein